MNIYRKNKYHKKVNIKEINAKSILRKHKKIDSWFLSRYGMNLYRGCAHNCVYCDGRSEKYNVEGEFGSKVEVKINAIEILNRELDPKRKKKPLKKGYVMVGGGVGDSYQPIEKKYELTRKTLELLYKMDFPVHVLTKSNLVEKDIDILKKINEKNHCIVSFSFSSANDEICSIFEPGVPPPEKRFETLEMFKEEGIPVGMFLLPVIPFITDNPKIIEDTIKKAKKIGIDFIIFGGMTLKDGRQKDYFYNELKKSFPDLLVEYNNIYRGDKWGSPILEYYQSIHHVFDVIFKKYNIPKRIPPYLYKDILEINDLVIVTLEHIDYLLRYKGTKSPYGYSAFSISRIDEPLSKMKGNLRSIKGIGPTTERIILEILDKGKSSYLEKLLFK
jgi:DNA repair photolyase